METLKEVDLNGIRVFREIVEAHSFKVAGDRLNIPTSMVSKRLAKLEHRLGVRLLHRSSRKLSLTEAGTAYYEQCRQALDILDAASSSAGIALAPRGELKISAPVWCANRHFARLLADYCRSYPEVRLDLHLDNHRVDLVSGGFDLGLRATGEPSAALIARRLCPIQFYCVATSAYLAQLEATTQPPSRPKIQLIAPNYLPIERIIGAALGSDFETETHMKASDTTLIYHSVMADSGAAILPSWLVDDDLASGRLRKVQTSDDPPVTGYLYAVYTSHRQMPPKLRSFIDFLVDRLGST